MMTMMMTMMIDDDYTRTSARVSNTVEMTVSASTFVTSNRSATCETNSGLRSVSKSREEAAFFLAAAAFFFLAVFFLAAAYRVVEDVLNWGWLRTVAPDPLAKASVWGRHRAKRVRKKRANFIVVTKTRVGFGYGALVFVERLPDDA